MLIKTLKKKKIKKKSKISYKMCFHYLCTMNYYKKGAWSDCKLKNTCGQQLDICSTNLVTLTLIVFELKVFIRTKRGFLASMHFARR